MLVGRQETANKIVKKYLRGAADITEEAKNQRLLLMRVIEEQFLAVIDADIEAAMKSTYLPESIYTTFPH